METIRIKPEGVCAREMIVEYENGIVKSMTVLGGCQGNLQGVSKLVEGRKIEDVVNLLSGIKCRGSRTGLTSCPDQLATGLKALVK